MTSLLVKVKTTMSIFAHRKTIDLLEGGYASVHRGRSHDFDDLRAYVPGDEVRDIDWKATARHGEPLVKQYIASRRHTLLLAVDVGRNMAATSESGESKKDIAILAAGALSSIATSHGDVVSMIAGDEHDVRSWPAGQKDEHLERLLRGLDDRIGLEAPRSDLRALLEAVARRATSRSLLLVITDDVAVSPAVENVVRRLRARHEILWLTVGDADLMSRREASHDVYDVQEIAALPAFVRNNARLRSRFAATATATLESTEHDLRLLGVTAHRISGQTDVVPGLFALLEKHRRAAR